LLLVSQRARKSATLLAVLETLDGRRREVGDIGQEDEVVVFIFERCGGHLDVSLDRFRGHVGPIVGIVDKVVGTEKCRGWDARRLLGIVRICGVRNIMNMSG
jgi:hypothetical protein